MKSLVQIPIKHLNQNLSLLAQPMLLTQVNNVPNLRIVLVLSLNLVQAAVAGEVLACGVANQLDEHHA
jgi:hypothetical protein